MAEIVRRRAGSKYYHSDYVDPATGQRVQRSTGCTNKGEARRRVRAWIAQAEQALVDADAGIRRASDITMADLAVKFLKRVKATCTERTFNSYLGQIRIRILPAFGADTRAASIGREKVAAWRDALIEGTAPGKSDKGGFDPTKPLSAATTNRYLVTLRRMFDHGVRAGLLQSNPAKSLPTIRERPEEKFRALTAREIREWVAHLDAENRTWVLFAVGTGLRDKELAGLLWENIKLDVGQVRVVAKRSKSSKGRWVPLTKPLIRLLLDYRPEPVDRRGAVFERKYRRRSLATGWSAAGLSGRPPSSHDLRHTYASQVLASGGTPSELRAAMGHSSLQTTEGYVHAYGEEHNTLLRKLNSVAAFWEVGEGATMDPSCHPDETQH